MNTILDLVIMGQAELVKLGEVVGRVQRRRELRRHAREVHASSSYVQFEHHVSRLVRQ